MEVKFSKYHGAGNDFIFIDNRDGRYKLNKDQREKMCQRHFGIGADGFIEIRSSDVADFKLIYFDRDGNDSTLCGNGSRCAIHFAFKIGIRKRNDSFNETKMSNFGHEFKGISQFGNEINKIRRNDELEEVKNKMKEEPNQVHNQVETCQNLVDLQFFTFEAFDGIHKGGVSQEITADSSNQRNMFYVDIKDVDSDRIKVYDTGNVFIDNGSPHHVAFLSSNIEAFDVVRHGRELRYGLYGNEGSSINFVSRIGKLSSYKKNLVQQDETKVTTSQRANIKNEDFEQNSGQVKQEVNDKSTDVNLGEKILFVRTYEIGVEDETMACGTGCVAAALADYIMGIKQLETSTFVNGDDNIKEDIATSSNITLGSKFGKSTQKNNGVAEMSNTTSHREKRVMKVLGGCLVVTFTVNDKEGSSTSKGITFSDIKLSGPAEHVFDGICTV